MDNVIQFPTEDGPSQPPPAEPTEVTVLETIRAPRVTFDDVAKVFSTRGISVDAAQAALILVALFGVMPQDEKSALALFNLSKLDPYQPVQIDLNVTYPIFN